MTDIRIDKKRLQTLMDMRELDNELLAAKMGKHYNSIIRLKQEQSTTLANLENLCQALRCHPFDLIVAEGFPEPFLEAQASR